MQHNAAAELGLTLQMHLFHNEVIYLDSYLFLLAALDVAWG